MDSKNTSGKLGDEVKMLLRELYQEEAIAEVWKRFDKAISSMDDEARSLLVHYFNGQLDRYQLERGLTKEEVKEWLSQVKKKLFEKLRRDCDVRQ